MVERAKIIIFCHTYKQTTLKLPICCSLRLLSYHVSLLSNRAWLLSYRMPLLSNRRQLQTTDIQIYIKPKTRLCHF